MECLRNIFHQLFQNKLIFNSIIKNLIFLKIFYNNLIKTNFPLEEVKTYILFEGNRWDLEINNNKIIKLPSKNYIKSLKNYINLKDKTDFKKYKLFDYRIKNQLILK